RDRDALPGLGRGLPGDRRVVVSHAGEGDDRTAAQARAGVGRLPPRPDRIGVPLARAAPRRHRRLRGGPRPGPGEAAMTRPHASSPRSAQPVSDAAVDALNKALAAEHAAVYAYGLAAARASGTVRERITGGFNAHRAQRDRLRALVVERGGTPAEAQPAYAVPFTPGSSAQA